MSKNNYRGSGRRAFVCLDCQATTYWHPIAASRRFKRHCTSCGSTALEMYSSEAHQSRLTSECQDILCSLATLLLSTLYECCCRLPPEDHTGCDCDDPEVWLLNDGSGWLESPHKM